MHNAHILLLEDDDLLADTVSEILREAGYRIDRVRDGAEAAECCYDTSYDLYIFDINVPEIDGIELLKDLRRAGDETPTIYITALVDLESMTRGFDAGAEDYLKKPFLPEELLIRVRARLRQRHPEAIQYADIEYHPDSGEVFKNGRILSLGHVQLRLLDALMEHIGKITPKQLLLDLLDSPSETALRVAMAKLKQKLGITITNIRGIGYMLEKV